MPPTVPAKRPPATLLSELAAIEDVADALEQRSAVCSQGGCLSTACGQAEAVRAAFSNLHVSVGRLAETPSAIVGEDRSLATPFLFDRLADIETVVLSVPALIAAGDYAAAEIRLLVLREEAHDSAELAPGSVEIFLADRMSTLRRAVAGVAEARRRPAPADEILQKWSDLASAGAHLLVETASLRSEQGERPDPFRALVRGEFPEPVQIAPEPCPGAVRLVRSVEARLAAATEQLGRCFQAASCEAESEGQAEPRRREDVAGRRALIDRIASDRDEALSALTSYRLRREADIMLTTDLEAYLSGEAIEVSPGDQTNQCLAETTSRLVLDRIVGDPAAGTQSLERVGEQALTSYDPAAWLYEAPISAGTYVLRLLTSENRGSLEFGRGPPITVSEMSGPCTGFTGVWQTDFGTLHLVVRDGEARGTYRQSAESRAGVLRGQVRNGRLTGRWISEIGTGGARMTLSEDGRSFRGTWGSQPSKLAGAGLWNGTCAASKNATGGRRHQRGDRRDAPAGRSLARPLCAKARTTFCRIPSKLQLMYTPA